MVVGEPPSSRATVLTPSTMTLTLVDNFSAARETAAIASSFFSLRRLSLCCLSLVAGGIVAAKRMSDGLALVVSVVLPVDAFC